MRPDIYLRDTHLQPLYISFDNVEGAPSDDGLSLSFAFPHTNGSPNFPATYHQSDVGPLSCRVTFKPVSVPLQHGIRFFQHPKPAPPWADPHGLLSSEEEQYGVSTFHAKK
jgi:hypothetical protein